ncbi:polysaccharide deacetylase family protein [Ferroglobus placidus]|uniref:hypothetical protein n=1 Tax=Ferroglobus placidus TaxID=54261 RepID=UPI000694EE58|nr:hypothetical protein [Ferroglobus placidus]
MEGKCIENFYSKIGAKLFSERNGLADNVVIKESGVISRNPEVQVSFSNESFDTSQLYDFFINNCNFSKFVEIQSKTHAGVDFNPFEIIGYIISGDFEKDCLKNGYDFAKIGRIPYLDILERNLVNIIADLYSQNGYPLFRKHLPLSICLTHDVDEIAKTYQYFTNALRHFKRMEIKDALREIYGFFHDFLKKENPFWTFEELMELEDSYEVKSTFFFLEETAKTSLTPKSWKHYGRRYKFDDKMVVEIIRSLDKGGWEIALHGSYNSFKDSKLMKLEKERLENVIGKEVSGIRQHNLNLTIPETALST